jgi:hypothetical protein
MSARMTGRLRIRALQNLRQGQPPPPGFARSLFVGGDELLQGLEQDLKEYVILGGSLLRVLAAPYGGGKTHFSLAAQAIAAEQGMLLAAVDVQSDPSGEGELALYRNICRNLTSPSSFLAETSSTQHGLAAILEEASIRLGSDVAVRVLRTAQVPLPFYRDALCDLLEIEPTPTPGRLALFRAIVGDSPGLSLRALRSQHPDYFTRRGLQRLPGKRDARLWTETLLVSLRALGYPGVMLTLDEHDEFPSTKSDLNIARLRSRLDALAAGALPGTFILYLVLETFRERVQAKYQALEQRIRPLLVLERESGMGARPKMAPQLYSNLADWQQLDDEELYAAIADRLVAKPLPASLQRKMNIVIRAHSQNLAQRSLRPFVQALAEVILSSEPKDSHDSAE